MPGNVFGSFFKVMTWGESHGKAVGAVIDGCPPGMALAEADIQALLDRRRPGKGPASTKRAETDTVQILSGIFEGLTTGTPISLLIPNKDAKSSSYEAFSQLYRPGHGDYSYSKKYGVRDWRGGGRASARETAARVAAAGVAKQLLARFNIRVFSYTVEMGGIAAKTCDMAQVDQNPFACPDQKAAGRIAQRVEEVKKLGDSIGGIVEVVATGVPPGLGEPVFDKLDAKIAYALMGIGAVKGVEIGAGFGAARLTGSINNDPITPEGFSSNNSGGILAGISSGQDIVARVAVKPIPSISIQQKTVTVDNGPTTLSVTGRHDVCAIPRINVVCEAMLL
ncbi:MAG: chorismate synthase, partial [Desulfatibacillaceae bacterium]|nr:chorismate synthase [Desulfatibacillaceae bacterium]